MTEADRIQARRALPPMAEIAPSRATIAVRFVRTRLFDLCIFVWSLLFGIAIMTYFKIQCRPREVRWILWLWTNGFIRAARAICGVRYRVEGLETVPDRPVVFVANHHSYWESIALCAFLPNVNVVTKRASMSIPVFGWGLRCAPMIPVDRDRPGQNLRRIVRQAKRSLAEGRSVLIFPEGQRVSAWERCRFQRGLELIYGELGSEVVPIVHNAGLLWPRGFEVKRPGLITMRFLPVEPAGEPPEAFVARLEALLNAEKDRLLTAEHAG
ncbi:MAG: lysophospholipid acyltransferase family protein [Pseudomonadota bacterium]